MNIEDRADAMGRTAAAQETLFALRKQIARMEGKALPAAVAAVQADAAVKINGGDAYGMRPLLAFDIPVLDEALDGGLDLASMTEIRSLSFYDAGSACGFVLSLAAQIKADIATAAQGDRVGVEGTDTPLLWIADGLCGHEAGGLHAGGLRQFGIDPCRFFQAMPRRLDDALWLAEAALTSRAFAATILEIHGNPKLFGLAESRRLSLRAKAAGRPLFLLRHAGDEEASSASLRMLIKPAPALERRLADGGMLGGSIGHSVFQLTLEKSRKPGPLSFLLEWNPRDRQFHLAQDPAGSAHAGSRPADTGAIFPVSGNRQDRTKALGHVVAFDRAS